MVIGADVKVGGLDDILASMGEVESGDLYTPLVYL